MCDVKNGGGWTVIQRRVNANVDFYRGWCDYKNGFGSLGGNFWLGLDRIHRLAKARNMSYGLTWRILKAIKHMFCTKNFLSLLKMTVMLWTRQIGQVCNDICTCKECNISYFDLVSIIHWPNTKITPTCFRTLIFPSFCWHLVMYCKCCILFVLHS